MASVIVIRIAGVDVTDDVILSDAEFNSQASGSPGLCKFRLKDMNYVYSIVVGQTITLDVDGQRVWGGWVQVVTRQFFFPYTGSPLSQPRQVGPHGDPCLGVGSAVSSIASTPRALVIEGADYNLLFRKRFAFNKANPPDGVLKSWPAGTHDDVQIRWLCEYDLDLSGDGIDYVTKVEYVGAPSPDAKGNPVGAGWSWEDGMRAIARYPGAIFYIDPDKYLVYTDVDTPNAPYGLSDVPSAGVLGYREMEVLHNGSNLVNDAMVWGAGQGANRVKFKRTKDTESIAAHGLWQVGDFRGDLWRQASIDKRSNSFVYGSVQNKRGGKDDAVSVQVALFKPGFRVAQKVNFSSNVFGFSDVIPIRRMKVTFPTPIEARFDLVLSHYIDEPWNTFEYWFPEIYIPPPVIPKTKITNCPVENYPRGSDTNTPLGPGGFTAVFGDDFNRASGTQPHSEMFGYWEANGGKWPPVIVNGGIAIDNGTRAIKLATPVSSDFQMLLAVDLSGWVNLGYYSSYGAFAVTANNSPYLLNLTPANVPTRLWAPVFIRVVSWTGQYLAYKIWSQNEPEPFYWTSTSGPYSTPISVDIYSVHFRGNYNYSGNSLPVLKGVTLFANDEDSLKLATFPTDNLTTATAYQPLGSSWGHTFKAPAYDESIIDFIYYPSPESSYRENTQFPSYQVHIQYSYFGGPTINWQQCYQHTVSRFTTWNGYRQEPVGSSTFAPEVFTAPEAIKITGKLKVEYSRSGGISAQPDPKEHQLEAYIEIFGFDEAQPLWLGEPYFRGYPFARKGYSFSNLFVWQGPQTRDFEIEMAYGGVYTADSPGRLRWGVSIENPIDRIKEIDGSHGPVMLANAADIMLTTTGVQYWARYPHVSGWTLMFCSPDSAQGGTTTQRTCEDVPLDLVMLTNNALSNPWIYQLSSAYIPGSVTVTVDGAIARPNLDFMELDHAAGTVRFLNSFNQAERVTICYFPES